MVEETEKLLRVMVSATNSTAFNVASSNTTVPVERDIYYLGRELLSASNCITRRFHPKSAFLHSMCMNIYLVGESRVVASDSYHRVSKMDTVAVLRNCLYPGDT